MRNKLEKSFKNYAEFSKLELFGKGKKKRHVASKGPLSIISNPKWEIQQKVTQLISKSAFLDLVRDTRSAFSSNTQKIKDVVLISYFKYFNSEEIDTDQWWNIAVYNFFCRTGFYHKIYEGCDVNIHNLYEQFCTAFQRKEFKTMYAAPMKEVEFSGRTLDFGDFRIQKFTASELDKMFTNEIHKTFYPEASFDSSVLSDYWFIVLEDIETIEERIDEYTQYTQGIVSERYTRFPRKLESALRPIILYDWKSWDDGDDRSHEFPFEWDKFEIPFVLKNDGNVLGFPERHKPLVELYGQKFKRDWAPPFLIHNNKETKLFKDFLLLTKKLIDNLELDSDELEYLNIALGYMLKAFFSKGFEGFVWHIVVLESLFGEKGGVVEKLAKRISMILAETELQRKEIRKEFKKLYDIRCSILHGKKFEGTVYENHLWKARDLARRSVLWYLHCLNYFKQKAGHGSILKYPPNRSELLTLIDLDRSSIPNIKALINSLPQGFPSIHEWIR